MMLRVIDLFCGPGGFSAGFEAAGFEIVAALDYDKDAVKTYSANHKIAAKLQDLTDFDYSGLPDADIVIGGPPCTQFSAAKSNRTRNVLDGILLVQSFLRCVYEKQPKYWIMENVPTIQKYLPANIPLRSIGIDADGDFHIPTKVELIAADYGVPQKRRRYLIGNFPIPLPTHYDPDGKDIFTLAGAKPWRTMGQVISHLPNPLSKPKISTLEDPNYGFSISTKDLSDHFYDARFTEVEQRSIHRAKTQHPYMGKLAWPDRTDRPARTVVATQLGRETLVLPTPDGEFRRATVRECASFQSFPTTYQFFGRSFGSKYRQAGDAVPPRLSFSLAQEIAKQEGVEISKPAFNTTVTQLANEIPADRIRTKRKPNFKRKVNFLVPSKEVRGTRCEFFVSSLSTEEIEACGHSFQRPLWKTDLVLGEGAKSTKRFEITSQVEQVLLSIIQADTRVSSGVEQLLREWANTLTTFKNGADVFANYILESYEKSPLRLFELAKELADCHLPVHAHHNTHIDCTQLFDHPKAHRIKVRVLVGCLMASMTKATWDSEREQVSALPSS